MDQQKTSIWKKDLKVLWHDFKEWIKTPEGKKKFIILIILLVVIAILAVAIYLRYFSKEKTAIKNIEILPAITKTEKPPEPKKIASGLDGVKYTEDVANRHALAIMIENHPEARPQSGLEKAKVIYEAITEGGITRFMALFGPESASKVGPVRSARTYYVDWDSEYDGFYAHVGGNIDALDLIKELDVKDLDQFKYGTQAYWREPQAGKATEHTMYTDTDKLWKIAENNEWDMKSSFDSFEFKDDAPTDQRPASQSIDINFSTPAYNVSWKYDKDNNNYQRSMAGSAHKDAESGNQLTAKNIIIQEVTRWEAPTRINEAGWAMKTVGSGKAKIINDGKVTEGEWKKEKTSSRTIFYDSNGNQVKFDAGVFWYEIVPPGTVITIE